MSRLKIAAASVMVVLTSLVVVAETTVELNAVTFPERRNIDLGFRATDRAPRAEIEAKVEFKDGQARVDIRFKRMKPAVLFGGNVTCYVVWALSRDGSFENLGELWMPESDGDVQLSSGRKSFALMITAEPYPLMDKPSDMVIFTSLPSDDKQATNSPFTFSGLTERTDHDLETIATIAWDSAVPLDVVQAEKALELARRIGAEDYASAMVRDANIALGQAKNLASASKTKNRIDYSRRSIALSSEAIQTTARKKEAEELARQIAERRAEMDALDERARSAEQRSAEAESALLEAQAAIAAANLERAQAQEATAAAQLELTKLDAERQTLMEEQAALNLSMATLRAEGDELRAETERLHARAEALREEREQLASRLQGALSQVADTQDTARGFIVNLPDILFDVNQATLKHEAQLVIAKLVGILLIMPELNLRIEGHTDSQGSDAYNQRLSEQRADSVKDFLGSSGIANGRMIAVGYGENRPVADNTTGEGRQKNRRVEVVIARGEIAEAGE